MANCEIPLNLVFVSGMYGAERHTLIYDFMQSKEREKLPFRVIGYEKYRVFPDNFQESVITAISKTTINFFRGIQTAIDNPNALVISNRCYWDTLCYFAGQYKFGWFSKSEYRYAVGLLQEAFSQWNVKNIRAFLLNPPFDYIKQTIAECNPKLMRKYGEKCVEFYKTIFDAYQNLFSSFKPHTKLESDIPPGTGIDCIVTDREERVKEFIIALNYQWNNFEKSRQKSELFAHPEMFHPFLIEKQDKPGFRI